MKNDVGDIKPWFREDLRRIMVAIYFAMKLAGWRMDASRWRGVVHFLAAFAMAVGVSPAEFMSEADVRLTEVL